MAIIDYIYEYILENGTILNLSSVKEDIYVYVYVPIIDLDLAKFNLAEEFAEKGYDIYDINSGFYNDFCTPTSLGDNDITLEDRIKDLYPHNVTLCKSNCIYKSINLEEQRVICSCNLNSNKTNDKLEEIDDNFVTYFIDDINYKVFTCYSLFFNIENLQKNKAFFIILIIFLILQIMNCIYICHTFYRFKIFMFRKLFQIKKNNIQSFTGSQKINDTQKRFASPPKKKLEENKNQKYSKGIQHKAKSEKLLIAPFNKSENYVTRTEKDIKKKYKKIKLNSGTQNKEENDENPINNDNKDKEHEEKINELPFSKAILVDKRNIIQIFFSFITEKLELIGILLSNHKIKIILLEEYILSLLINFFINALLYSDEVVSNKYHNNGKLDLAVSLVLSILSNIVTSIICYFLKYSRGFEEWMNLILEIKYRILII